MFFKFAFSFHDKRKIAKNLLCSWFCQLSNELYCLIRLPMSNNVVYRISLSTLACAAFMHDLYKYVVWCLSIFFRSDFNLSCWWKSELPNCFVWHINFQALSDEASFWGGFGFYAILTMVCWFKIQPDNMILFPRDLMHSLEYFAWLKQFIENRLIL